MTVTDWKQKQILTTMLLVPFVLGFPIRAQGCSQCRDNTAATPARTQHAYRDAILLLTGTALSISSAVIFIGRRFR